ncbi:MAG: glycosyltransferase [Litorivicinus sp.]
MKVSVIVTTYNWPEALDCVIQSLFDQSVRPAQVLVADDGSGDETRRLVEAWVQKWPVVEHVWHVDEGFRAGEIRNRAIQRSTSPWLVMIDGDCVCPRTFIERHLALAAPDRLVAGNRLLLSKGQTAFALAAKGKSAVLEVAQQSNKKHKLWDLPLGPLRDRSPCSWESVRTCNLGVARSMAVGVGGFDESYRGWGKEDSDFAARCVHAGAKVRQGRFATTVIHLFHPEASRDQLSRNQLKLDAVLENRTIKPAISCLMDEVDES